MRNLMALIGLAAASAAGAAAAAPSVEIRDAAARVVVMPESRSDVQVTIVRINPRLPLVVEHEGDRTIVKGDVGRRVHGCNSVLGRPVVKIAGVGDVGYDDLPQVVIHTPMDVKVAAAPAVFGAIGRSATVDFANAGCGDWTIGNVTGLMRLSQAGSGDTRAGSAGAADLRIAGSGDITTQAIHGDLTAVSAGSGDITAASVDGAFNVRVAGSGDVRANAGTVSAMTVAVAGSGDVDFGGTARSLRASVVGSGDVHAAEVTGPVSTNRIGSGDVRIGR